MKRTLAIILTLILSLGLFTGCKTETLSETVAESKVISPLPESLDINNLNDCTVAISLEKGDAYVDDSGKMVMKLKVYTYELYDMVDIATLDVNDTIIRHNEEVKITEIDRLDTGLIRINGGEESGGFDLVSSDSTVYFEIGANDIKNYYELGEITLPVSDEFEYIDESDLDSEAKIYYPGDFLTDDAGILYNFKPSSTKIVIEDGVITKMVKVYNP